MMENSARPSTTQIILLATSSAFTAFFYSVYRKKSGTACRLKEATKISIDQDLKNILSVAPGKCVPYAVIQGVVKSVKETLSSQFVDNCKGVIERLTLQEHKMVWNRTTHLWVDTLKLELTLQCSTLICACVKHIFTCMTHALQKRMTAKRKFISAQTRCPLTWCHMTTVWTLP
ncbi:mitochondrial ubiquitin ligase activator of NFKB 1 isoform X3 [Acipenser ruthenus]|uniref:mitochondrial ubiquitin ligase activator of NFKB 1 isoform X3 n=1 Tax=Acipenser ruthenus TaxID=7906 RepID=UPI0015617D3D|nr:mitochondrial ubiquitin ligase activator of NFKB 1 isoform X3 [Acipenser ruthenus]